MKRVELERRLAEVIKEAGGDCQIEHDNDGQIVVYTCLMEDGDELVPFVSEDES